MRRDFKGTMFSWDSVGDSNTLSNIKKIGIEFNLGYFVHQ